MALESDLYAPVKALLEGQGYVVKGEVRGCDVVGVRGNEPPVVVELKRVFGLGLVLQGVDRLALSDKVYLAVGQWPKQLKNVRKLCRRLGLGLIVVAHDRAEVVQGRREKPQALPQHKRPREACEGERQDRDRLPGFSSFRQPLATIIPFHRTHKTAAIGCINTIGYHNPSILRTMYAAPSLRRSA